MRAQPGRVGPSYEELKIVERLIEIQHREEIMWHQRSRIQWLAEGDKNTKFFHLRASKRKRRNKIISLTRANGTVTNDQHEISRMARDFYSHLYTSEGTTGMEEVLPSVSPSVTVEMNERLLSPFEAGEVK
jgi:predicted transcriptional regulator